MANKKPARMQTFKLDVAIVERLDRHSAETGVPKTFTVERALDEYLGRIEDEKRRAGLERASMDAYRKGGA